MQLFLPRNQYLALIHYSEGPHLLFDAKKYRQLFSEVEKEQVDESMDFPQLDQLSL
jgi:hypothetical protein